MRTQHVFFAILLALVIVVDGCSSHSFEDSTAGADSTEQTGNEILDKGGGNNDGDPIIYKKNPTIADPKNKYTQYLRAPTGTWYVNKIVPKTELTSISSSGAAGPKTTDITIKREINLITTETFKQVASPTSSSSTLTASQSGRTAKVQAGDSRLEEDFLANNRGKIDVLVVMDNSGSMYQESQYIKNYLPELMKHIWRSDWRLGMTNSSGSKCNVTTLTAAQAGDKSNTIAYRLDRDSMVYNNFHHDLERQTSNKPTPWYLAPYFYHHTGYTGDKVLEKSDYRWLSPCAYNILGSCSSSRGDDYDYRNNKSYNPLKYYFGAEGLNIFTSDASATDSGDEKMLSKVRWVLEGKAGTTCDQGWARDKATVIAIVITDEGHNCSAKDHAYCSIDSYKAFASQYGSKRKFKTYGILSSTKQPDSKYIPQWDSDELGALDGYVIAYNEKFEGGSILGYFENLSQGYYRYSPPDKVPSSNTSYYNRLSSGYGHRPLHLISLTIADELRNIYSPLAHVPDIGTAEVKIASYSTNKLTKASEYKYGAALDPCGTQGLGAKDPCYVVHAEQRAFELVQHGNMSHFDKKVKITYNYGGTSVSGLPFDTSWELAFAPDPASVNFSVTLSDGTTHVLGSTQYTITGKVVSVAAGQVQNLVPEGSSVTITYKKPVALINSFDLRDAKYGNGAYVVAASDLVRGKDAPQIKLVDAYGEEGKNWLSSGFTFDGTTVRFQQGSAPVAGGGFLLQYNHYTSIVTDYPYIRNPNTTDDSIALTCAKKNSGAAVACSHDPNTNEITFTDSSQFSAGDVITVTDVLKPGITISDHILPDNYVESQGVSASAGGSSCSIKEGNLLVSGNIIQFSALADRNCGIIDVVNTNPSTQVSLTYSVYENLAANFLQMDSKFFERHRGKYKFEWWDVSIGGTTTTDFVVENYKIVEIDKVMTDDADGIMDKYGDNAKIQVVVRLYHAL